jgi:tetratricopeptide (TPR) repeat protein
VLSTVAEEIDDEKSAGEDGNRPRVPIIKYSEDEQMTFFEYATQNRYLVIAVSTILLFVLVFAVTNFSIAAYRRNSSSYQLERARSYFAVGDYENAIAYMGRAVELKPNDIAARMAWSDYYYANRDFERAVEVLLEAIASPDYTWLQKDQCYDRLIWIWDSQRRYQKIVDLLKESRDEDLLSEYSLYLSPPPIFSEEQGVFTDSLSLRLSAEKRGKIFYTIDGSEPTANSSQYTAPIFLDDGDFYVAAVFENEYGIFSEVVVQNYFIDKRAPEPPRIALSSGRYIQKTLINVEVPEGCLVYYTTDGSIPNSESSALYTSPIAIPFGVTEYTFVAVNEEGFVSASVERTFEYRIESSITPEIAVASVMRAHLNNGRIISIDGKAADAEGYYSYRTDETIEVPNQGLFYLVKEYYSEGGRAWQESGHWFASNAYTGAPVHLVYNDQGVLDTGALE